jgi:hypothetical protein
MRRERDNGDGLLVFALICLFVAMMLQSCCLNPKYRDQIELLQETTAAMENELDAKHRQLGVLTRAVENHRRLHWLDDIAEGRK